jgi:hypothetical protein
MVDRAGVVEDVTGRRESKRRGGKKGVAGERIRRWGFPRGSFAFFCRNFLQNATHVLF